MTDSEIHSLDDAVDQFVSLLKAFNDTTNIYSKSAYQMLPFHIIDSLTLSDLIPGDPCVIADMGSGSGLPSFFLAYQQPQRTVYAIESKSRKRQFLIQLKSFFSLSNFHVFEGDVSQFSQTTTPPIDFVTAKAFAPATKCIALADRLLRPGGQLFVPISHKQKKHLEQTCLGNIVQHSLLNHEAYLYFTHRNI